MIPQGQLGKKGTGSFPASELEWITVTDCRHSDLGRVLGFASPLSKAARFSLTDSIDVT